MLDKIVLVSSLGINLLLIKLMLMKRNVLRRVLVFLFCAFLVFSSHEIIAESYFKRNSARFDINQKIRSEFISGMSANLFRYNQKITLIDDQKALSIIMLGSCPIKAIKELMIFNNNHCLRQ